MLNPKILKQPWEASQALDQIGLSIPVVHQAVDAGHLARVSCTENDALFIPGTYAWGSTLRRLRELLLPQGWYSLNIGSYSLTVSDKHQTILLIESGDDATGLDYPNNPSTNSKKGAYTALSVARSAALQMSFFDGFDADTLRRFQRVPHYPTWIFLIRITDELVRCEVSLPDRHASERKLSDWKERILIPELSFIPDPLRSTDDEEPQDVEVKVSRKD